MSKKRIDEKALKFHETEAEYLDKLEEMEEKKAEKTITPNDVLKEQLAPIPSSLEATALKDLDIPAPSYIIDELIVKGAITVIGAPQGSYKTYTAVAMAMCISSGTDFLGLTTKKNKVMILDCESSQSLAQKRQNFLEAGGLPLKENSLFYEIGTDYDLNSSEGLEKLKKEIEEKKIGVLIIDVWRGLVRGIRENSADDVREWFSDGLRPLIADTGVTVVLITHTRKMKPEDNVSRQIERIRGSSEFTNASDLVLMLLRRKGENFAYLVCEKNKYGLEAKRIGIEYNFDNQNRSLTLQMVDKEIWMLGKTKMYVENVWNFLIDRKKTTFKTKDVKDFLKKEDVKGVSKVAQRVLEDLINVERVRKVKRGVYEIVGEDQKTL